MTRILIIVLGKYNFRRTEYPETGAALREVLASTRGRNADGTPKVINRTNDEMVDRMEEACGHLVDNRFFDAFRRLDRADFLDWENVPEEHRKRVVTPYTFLACVFDEGQTVPAANMLLFNLHGKGFEGALSIYWR